MVAFWVMAIHTGNKVDLYLSDIAAAFGRIFKQYMLAKCRRAGASDCFLTFLSDLLVPRRASVIVDGVSSDPFTTEDIVFQGTHFGPPLWNIFFADVSGPAGSSFGSRMAAGQLSAWGGTSVISWQDDGHGTLACSWPL